MTRRLGLDQGLLKDPDSFRMPTSAEKQPTKKRRTLPGVSYRDAASTSKMAIVREKCPEDELVEEDIKYTVVSRWEEHLPPQNLLSARRSVDLFCENQESCNWLSTHINVTKLRDKFVLKAMETKNVPKPI